MFSAFPVDIISAEAYSETCQVCKTECFGKIVTVVTAVNYFRKTL